MSSHNNFQDEALDEKANELLGEETVKNLASANWKERLAAMEKFTEVCVADALCTKWKSLRAFLFMSTQF